MRDDASGMSRVPLARFASSDFRSENAWQPPRGALSACMETELLFERLEPSRLAGEPRRRRDVGPPRHDGPERSLLSLADRVFAVERADRLVHRLLRDAQAVAVVPFTRPPAPHPL